MEWFVVGVVTVGIAAAFVWLLLFMNALKQFSAIRDEIRNIPPASIPHSGATANPNGVKSAEAPLKDAGGVPRRIIHDLNNAIGTITGFTDAALEDLPNDHPVCGDLMEIKEAAHKVKSIVKTLDGMSKDYARPFRSSQQPAAASKPALSSVPPSRVDCATGTEHLLIIDDEIQLLRMFRRFFEPLGYQVTTFSESIKAWEAFKTDHKGYDLAIVDERMPDLSGSQLAKSMLSVRPDLPIILLSGYSDPISPAEANEIGIRRFLSKPIPQAELNATVRSVLDKKPG